jgi:type I restriction enzyme S subunit
MGREHWVDITLNQACSKITDGTHQTPTYEDSGIPFISTANIFPFSKGFNFSEYKRYISKEDHLSLIKRSKPEKGDILISKCGTIGRTKEIDVDYEFSIFVGLALLKPLKNHFAKKYLEYVINSPSIQKQLLELAPGTTRKTLTLTGINTVTIPLPPLNEQKRIIEKLDVILPKVKNIKKRLEKVPVMLRKFKQSVLAAAFSKRLTEDWRNGKDLPEWDDILSKELFSFVTSGSRGWAKYYSESGSLFLRVGNLDHHTIKLDLSKKQYVNPPRNSEGTRTEVKVNDLLISITADVGMIGLVPENFEKAYINQHISLARPKSIIHPAYLAWYLTSAEGQFQFQEMQRGATKVGLGLDDIKNVKVPYPPIEEQKEIVKRLERLFALADSLEVKYKKAMESIEKIEQAVLAKAFRGELVEASLEDEPAEKLLKRILAEKEKLESKINKRKKKI